MIFFTTINILDFWLYVYMLTEVSLASTRVKNIKMGNLAYKKANMKYPIPNDMAK